MADESAVWLGGGHFRGNVRNRPAKMSSLLMGAVFDNAFRNSRKPLRSGRIRLMARLGGLKCVFQNSRAVFSPPSAMRQPYVQRSLKLLLKT